MLWRLCWLEQFNFLCYCYVFTEALGRLELILKFPLSCSTAEEVIHIYQSLAKFSIQSTANSLVGRIGDFAGEHRHIVWQWLLLLFHTLDKIKIINQFSELHSLLQQYKLLSFFISAFLLLKLEFECT